MSITLIIIVITVIVSIMAFNDSSLKYNLTFSAYAVKHQKKWWLLFTHGFVHGDYMHLFFNMYVLYNFGNAIEVYFELLDKPYLYPFLYLSALPAACVPALFKHSDNINYFAVGASGAVTAIIFYYILLAPFSTLSLILLPIPIPAIIFGVLYIVFEYYQAKKGGTNIAHDAHMAGAAYALVFILLFNREVFTLFFYQLQAYF
jgi:membrane associated rhomboid family serine protease